MSKHTPGPWITKWNSGSIDVFRLHEDGSFSRIPHVKIIKDFDHKKMRANANLIVAAPDLIEALKEITSYYADLFDLDCESTNPGIKHCIRLGRAVIAKATGENK